MFYSVLFVGVVPSIPNTMHISDIRSTLIFPNLQRYSHIFPHFNISTYQDSLMIGSKQGYGLPVGVRRDAH